LNRQVPWLRVFVEGVVIVASILMAFGVQAWWDGRQERVLRTQYLTALTQELTENRDLLERTIANQSTRLDAFDQFYGSTASSLRELPEDSARSLLGHLVTTTTISLRESVVNSDEVELVNAELRRAIGAWIGLAADQEEDLPYISQWNEAAHRRMIDVSPEIDRAGTLDDSHSAALGALREDAVYIRERLMLQRRVEINRRKLERLRDQTDRVLELIQERSG
jgi:hypothetical protein